MHKFYFHEDDPGQYSLKPIEWWEYYEREFGALEGHIAEHYDPDSYSLDQMYTPGESPSDLPALEMSEQRFIELLSPHGKQFDRIESNLSEFDSVRSVGFGPSEYTGIVADLKGTQVGWLWCMPYGDEAEQVMMRDLLRAAATDQHLLLADWHSRTLIDLRDRHAIQAFLG